MTTVIARRRRSTSALVALAVLALGTACGSGEGTAPAGSKVVGYEPGTMPAPVQTTLIPRATLPPDDSAPPEDAALSGTSTPAAASTIRVAYRIDDRVRDRSSQGLAAFVSEVLTDRRSWTQAGFEFFEEPTAAFSIVLAEPAEVDRLCLPLRTGGKVSCQNGPVVAINAERWRKAIPEWTAPVADYRRYVVNHEVGHLVGMRHPAPQCPVAKQPASVMDQQTKGLAGCQPNWWPLPWELELARKRPAVLAPKPDWNPGPPPRPPAA